MLSPVMFAAMDNLQQPPAPPTSSNSAPGTHPSILDPRKQELLEARFMGSNQRMAAAGFTNQTQTSQQHYLHHSLTPHPTLPPHPHHSHSPQSVVQHQLQSSSSTSSNPSSSSPSIPPNGSPFSSMLSQQQAPPPSSLQPQQSPQPPQPVQNQASTSLGAMMQTTNSVPTGGSSFTNTSNNNSLNNLPNANNNSAGSTQSSCHYSAHSSSHNQDSNLSTTSAGSHCSDKQEPPIHCDTLHAHNLPPTPEKRGLSQTDPTTPTGANGALNNASTGSQRKRRKKDLSEPPPPPQERANSVGSKRGENKKVTDYFKVTIFLIIL